MNTKYFLLTIISLQVVLSLIVAFHRAKRPAFYKFGYLYRKGCFDQKYTLIGFVLSLGLGLSLFATYSDLVNLIPKTIPYDTQEILKGVGIGIYISIPLGLLSLYQGTINKKKFFKQVYADTPEKKWILALSAIYALESSGLKKTKKIQKALERLDYGSSKIEQKIESELLLQEWNITNKESLLNYFNENLKTMSAKQYDARFLAWDLLHVSDIIRKGYRADLLSSDEAWIMLKKIAQKIRENFSSWQELNKKWEQGVLLNYSRATLQNYYSPFTKWLKTNDKSPWQVLPWPK